jgi:hypothetical protein
MDKTSIIKEKITKYSESKFTGVVVIRLDFNQGGIRGAKCTEEHEIKFEN